MTSRRISGNRTAEDIVSEYYRQMQHAPKQEERIIPPTIQPPASADSSFILSYDQFGRELITKSNELFSGTAAEIPIKDKGEVSNMHMLKRLALTTAIYNNHQLSSTNILPITPLQSEQLLKDGKLPKPSEYWEDLGLLLYDHNSNGINPKEAQALYSSLLNHHQELGLSIPDLEQKLLIVHAGLEKDSSYPRGVKPIVLPGLTRVHSPAVLSMTKTNHKFDYGLDQGVPFAASLGAGARTLYMPAEDHIGLRLLCRGGALGLDAWSRGLASSGAGGRVNLARQGAPPKS